MAEGIIVFMLWYIAIAFNYYIEKCTKGENEEGTQTRQTAEKCSTTVVACLSSNDKSVEEDTHGIAKEKVSTPNEKIDNTSLPIPVTFLTSNEKSMEEDKYDIPAKTNLVQNEAVIDNLYDDVETANPEPDGDAGDEAAMIDDSDVTNENENYDIV
ncbi:uncharacterized protein LOC128200530 [Galleria mellonella]|uniref:Uncharacterized protein LOC128200530 n=1 Tax=Galleria mellonella TaxID=7137 RepID=A0ABM3MFM3_GALME|nr:uncharacterized protein LOC128200530 [Galleria mellonella]XP_052750202.1 uncharacterized protein LOC128200530 [Galleria mellonella]